MAYKQNFKSPILKALVGKQHNLPQHLQNAIKAAPESPAKLQTKDKPSKDKPYAGKPGLKKAHAAHAQALLEGKILPAGSTKNMSAEEVIEAARKKGVYDTSLAMAKRSRKKAASPAKKGEPKKPKRDIKKEKAQKAADDIRIQRRMARSEYYDALKTKAATEKRLKGRTDKDARIARENADKEVKRTRHNERVAHKGGEGLGTGEYKMRTFNRKKRELPKPQGANTLKSPAKKTVDPTKPRKKGMKKRPTAEESKARREAMRGGARKKERKAIRSGEELTGKKPKANKTFKTGPLGPYKPAPKSKNKGPKQTLKGNVIKY